MLDDSNATTESFRSDVADAAGAINRLVRSNSACLEGVMASTVLLQHHLWLSLTGLREENKITLVNCPVSTDGLFGHSVSNLLDQCKARDQTSARPGTRTSLSCHAI